MRLEIKQPNARPDDPVRFWRFEVALSRRNLLSLLHKLDMPGSARRIESNEAYTRDRHIANLVATVRCEPDEEHYGHPLRRSRLATPMHPHTEAYVAEHYVPGREDDPDGPMFLPSYSDAPTRYELDFLQAWVYEQDRVWLDSQGREHAIAEMSSAEVDAVLTAIRQAPFDVMTIVGSRLARPDVFDAMISALLAWLESLPVMRALKGRRDEIQGSETGADTGDAASDRDDPGSAR